MRTRRIRRLLKLMQALQSGRSKTVDDLSELTGVSRRTVFRDLDLLGQAGLRYVYDRTTRRYSIAQSTLLPPVTLSHAEALALMLAARSMAGRRFMPDGAAAGAASLKLESMLPAPLREYCGPIVEHMEIREDPTSDTSAILDILSNVQAALTRRKKIRAAYDSYFDGRVIDVVIHPYRLAYVHRGWYVIAFTEAFDEVRTYKLERMLRFVVTDESYEIDPKFNLDDYFGHAWLMIRGDRRYHVKARFLEKVAGNVDEIAWHKTQRTTYQEDGSLLFEVDVDGIDEISWWLLGYGDQAQVLEPPELRELVARRVERMYSYYRGDGTVGG